MNTRFSVDHFCCNSNLCVSAPAISIHCKQVQANNRIKSNFCSFSLFWNLQAISHHFMILQVKFNLTVSCSRKQINFQQPSWTATARCGTGNLLLSPATSGGVEPWTKAPAAASSSNRAGVSIGKVMELLLVNGIGR